MIGLLIMTIFGGYLVLSIWLVSVAVKCARKRGITGWKWGVPVGLVLYMIPFWEHIPTIIAHRYYCATEGGFVVYKTLEQWNHENPEWAGKLTPTEGAPSERHGDTLTFFLNERFNWVIKRTGPHFTIWRTEDTLVDSKTGDVLARSVDFGSGFGNFMLGGSDWRVMKFWLSKHECPDTQRGRFRAFKNSVK